MQHSPKIRMKTRKTPRHRQALSRRPPRVLRNIDRIKCLPSPFRPHRSSHCIAGRKNNTGTKAHNCQQHNIGRPLMKKTRPIRLANVIPIPSIIDLKPPILSNKKPPHKFPATLAPEFSISTSPATVNDFPK